jgi:hypothetical protein
LVGKDGRKQRAHFLGWSDEKGMEISNRSRLIQKDMRSVVEGPRNAGEDASRKTFPLAISWKNVVTHGGLEPSTN